MTCSVLITERCTLAPENDLVDETIRQLHFGKGVSKFRALFLIRDSQVVVLHIRRGTMDRAEPADFACQLGQVHTSQENRMKKQCRSELWGPSQE